MDSQRSSGFVPSEQPLNGVRIIDFTQAVFGAGATLLLGDLGADVIKVEHVRGDFMRHGSEETGSDGASWLAMNRNKRSIAIGLRDERCQRLLKMIVPTADVLIHNFRAGRIERLGFGHDVVEELNPTIVYVDMTAWGYAGPMRTWAGGDMWAQAFGGAVSVPRTGTQPTLVDMAIGDQSGALIGALAVCAGLLARRKTGLGQRMETSLVDAVLAMQSSRMGEYLVEGTLPGTSSRLFPGGPYTAADGNVLIWPGGHGETSAEGQWSLLCHLLEIESLLGDERYKTHEQRIAQRLELYTILNRAFRKRTCKEWQEHFFSGGLRCDPCNDYPQLFRHPQLLANDHIWEVEHPIRGKIRLIAPPIVHNGTRGSCRRPPPLLGQHTKEILEEVGISGKEIDDLLDEGLLLNNPIP